VPPLLPDFCELSLLRERVFFSPFFFVFIPSVSSVWPAPDCLARPEVFESPRVTGSRLCDRVGQRNGNGQRGEPLLRLESQSEDLPNAESITQETVTLI
jgi:hypothetical protein